MRTGARPRAASPGLPGRPGRPGRTGRRAVTVALSIVALLGAGNAVADRGDGAPPGAGSSAGWVRPVAGAVVRPFDPPAEEWAAGHRGVDLAATTGAAVRAPARGSVAFAGAVAGKPVVVVAHDDGLRSTFEPAVAAVPRGSAVATGDVVARVAPTGGRPGSGEHCAAAGCLHWGVLRGETYLDPLLLLGEDVPIVLLPAG